MVLMMLMMKCQWGWVDLWEITPQVLLYLLCVCFRTASCQVYRTSASTSWLWAQASSLIGWNARASWAPQPSGRSSRPWPSEHRASSCARWYTWVRPALAWYPSWLWHSLSTGPWRRGTWATDWILHLTSRVRLLPSHFCSTQCQKQELLNGCLITRYHLWSRQHALVAWRLFINVHGRITYPRRGKLSLAPRNWKSPQNLKITVRLLVLRNSGWSIDAMSMVRSMPKNQSIWKYPEGHPWCVDVAWTRRYPFFSVWIFRHGYFMDTSLYCLQLHTPFITAQSIWSKIKLKRNRKNFFPSKYAILSFGKCLYYEISGFQRGDKFLNCDNTKLKRSSKINFSVSKRHRWVASLGGSGLILILHNSLHRKHSKGGKSFSGFLERRTRSEPLFIWSSAPGRFRHGTSRIEEQRVPTATQLRTAMQKVFPSKTKTTRREGLWSARDTRGEHERFCTSHPPNEA